MDKQILRQYNTLNDDFYFHHTYTPPNGQMNYYGPESHDRFELFYLLKGEVEYLILGERYVAHAGDMLFVSPSKIHSLLINGNLEYERMVYVFDHRVYDEILRKYPLDFSALLGQKGRVIQKEIIDRSEIKKIFLAIVNNCEEEKYQQLHIISNTIRLLIELDKLFADESLSLLQPESTDPFIESIVNYVQEHITDPINLDQIAEHLFISKSALCHKFRQKTNMTINQYIHIKKIYYAQDLIYNGANATQVSQDIGYNYYTTFYYNYKKILGKAPGRNKDD